MASFVDELKRRKVIRAGVAYAVVAWLLIEVVSTVFPILQIPEWVVALVTMLLIIGFPIALILSWAFDFTPGGIERTGAESSSTQPAASGGRRLDSVIIACLVLALGFVVADNYIFDAERPALPNSVAVLPFANLSPDPDNAFFAAGVHETILNEFAKIADMNVIARTSVLQYAGAQTPISEIAAELGVETIMEGSVQRAGESVRITAQLIDPATGAHLWSENYDRSLDDIFAIQTDIATQIAAALEAELSPNEIESLERRPTASIEAWELYLRALELEGGGDFVLGSVLVRSSIESYLDQALEIDPEFALAYANRAHVLGMILNGDVGTNENYATQRAELEARALADLERALEIDPNLGAAYAALARIHQYNWRAADALAAFEKAIELSPNDPQALVDFGNLNAFVGRHERAIALGLRAIELAPNSGNFRGWAGEIYRTTGDQDSAIESYRRAVELDPNYLHSRFDLAFHEYLSGNAEESLAQLRIARRIAEGNTNPVLHARNGYLYGRLGEADEAAGHLRWLEQIGSERRVPAIAWVIAHLGVGDTDRALEWLETLADEPQAYEGHYMTIQVSKNTYQDPVLELPEFVALRERIGFTDI